MVHNWNQIKSTVADALELPRDQRAGFLDRACAGDPELRREVESLLAANADDDSLPGARDAVANAARSFRGDSERSEGSALRDLEHAIGGQYEILKPLGSGGMATVYLARERALDRFVAIKVLRPDQADAATGRERFRREARVAAQLSHPGIVPLHSFGEAPGGLWYFVMAYARGKTLAERLRLEGRIPWVEAHRILTALADALECAHRHGVVHRDIKPANILLDDDSGQPLLADFGISKVASGAESLTATDMIVGTPDFMSPEQVERLPDIDGRSDIYSFGAVAYRMLAGRNPFDGRGAREQMMQRITSDPAPLQSVAPAVPAAIASVVMKCLVRDRNARWRDAGELRQALARAGASASEALPETVRDLPSFGAYALLWAIAWGAFAMLSDRAPGERALLLLIAFLVPLGLILHIWNVGRHGLGVGELARVAAWPPEWWSMWWPSSLRRPSDVWPRLPFAARLVRGTLSAFFVVVPTLILSRQWLSRSGWTPADGWLAFELAQGAAIVITAVVVVGAFAWAQRRELTIAEAIRLLLGATAASPSWLSPSIARVLKPTAGAVRPPDRDVAADHLRALEDLAGASPVVPQERSVIANEVRDLHSVTPNEGTDLHLVLREAIDAAREAVARVHDLEGELGALSRDASPAEVDRLSAQLASFGDPSVGNAERRELRELVSNQLEIVRKLRARHEEVARERARIMDLLRGLWSQALDARQAGRVDQMRATIAELRRAR
jgi:serine/threonine protein kinase